MKWYIGQPIVAIENHSTGAFKKGQDFVIKGIKSKPCGCDNVLINIGIITSNLCAVCSICGQSRVNDWYYSELCFAPLDQDISELTEILTQKQPFEP